MAGDVHISTLPPPTPGDADFAIYINFAKGIGNPSRVFLAADAIIRALQDLDKVLSSSIDSHIEPILVLEEIETGSLKIWLKSLLTAVDDDALKTLDWKPAIGRYLVRAKYAYIEWANRADPKASLVDLSKKLAQTASETDVKHLPDYAPPSVRGLADVAKEVDDAKSFLTQQDTMAYLPAPSTGTGLVPLNFNLSARFAPDELIALARKETLKFDNMPMNLIVKRPDYLGASMWDFRHGKTPVSAKIADADWLKRFQAREIDVRPGDALRCVVTIERGYGFDNELIDESYTVTKVEAVLQNQARQGSLLDRG